MDIIDSINDNINLDFPLKAILYKILKKYPNDSVNHLGKFHYPNIADKDKLAFLGGLVDLAQKFLKSQPNASDIISTLFLIRCLIDAKTRKELTFIQDETPDEWGKVV